MAAAEDYFDSLKQNQYENKYLDKYTLGTNPKNPICNVVPLSSGDFFGPYVCNVIVLTGVYVDWDEDSVSEAKQRIIDTYDKFVKYELHIMIDGTAENVQDADEDDYAEMVADLVDLANELAEYGVLYYGQLDEGAIKEKIAEILEAFYT